MLPLHPYHPESTSELIQYQQLIVSHSKRFEYPAWVHNVTEFRWWAAANQYTQWSQILPQIYAFVFTGWGIAVGWCPIRQIYGGNHSYDCPKFTLRPQSSPPPSIHISTLCSYCPFPSSSARFLSNSKPRPSPAKLPNLTTVSFLTDIKPPVHMGQIVSPSMLGEHCYGGHPVSSCRTKSAS